MAPKQSKFSGPLRSPQLLRVVPIAEPAYDAFLVPVNVAVAQVARRLGLSRADEEDLRSDLWVRLLADRGRALRSFCGRASLETYLGRVARNLVIDQHQKQHGKWRPSAAARRAGKSAVLVERMVSRDGESTDAALEWIQHARPADAAVLRSTLAAVTVRFRRRFLPLDSVPALAAGGPTPLDVLGGTERAQHAARLRLALARILQVLPALDRRLLAQRFVLSMTLAEIAAAEGLEAKPLYGHFARVLARIRKAVVRAGVSAFAIPALLKSWDPEWSCGLTVCVSQPVTSSVKSA